MQTNLFQNIEKLTANYLSNKTDKNFSLLDQTLRKIFKNELSKSNIEYDEIQEISQIAIVKIYSRLQKDFDTNIATYAYFLAVLRNSQIDYHNIKNIKIERLEQNYEVGFQAIDLEHNSEYVKYQLEILFKDLKGIKKDILLMYYFKEFKVSSICKITNFKEEKVKAILYQARLNFRRKLAA